MFNLEDLLDFDNMPPKKRRIVIRLLILGLCILTTLGGILFSSLTW